jgi:hypothetical protein
VSNDELDELRTRLAARRGVAWVRLEDAAVELWSLHAVSEEAIVARIVASIERERARTPDADDKP